MIIYSQKYYNKYNQIVKHYKELNLQKSDDLYTESHHITPRSMGGSNKKDNLVRVPARVHFLLHWMLYRIYRTQEMARAWHYMSMSSSTHSRYTSRSFDYARIARNTSMIGKPGPNTGRKVSDETKKKLSIANSGKPSQLKGIPMSKSTKEKISAANKGKLSPMKGKTHSAESKAKMSQSKTGKVFTNDHRNNMSVARKGICFTEEHKNKISNAHKGREKSMEHRNNLKKPKNSPIVTCIHCNKSGKACVMYRYHFDNCKLFVAKSVP